MKLGLSLAGLLFCSVAQASLEDSANRLSQCVISYAEKQTKTSKLANRVAEEAFGKCNSDLTELHDSIGPDKDQWDALNKSQQQSIMKVRDQTSAKVREQLTAQIIKYVTEERNSM